MVRGLKVSEDLLLPIDIVTQTQVILAKKGAGKTYTAAVEIEEALKHDQQVVILDPTGAWWGLKSTADGERAGFAIAIFGGEHQDIPLEESAGEVVATAIVERQFSAVIDLSLFRKAQMHRFLVPFLETLYRINRHSLLLVVDEADFAAPQKPFGEEARTLGAMQDIVRRGRIRGLGCAMITQRPQVLNKDVLTQADMLVALRMNHPKDLAAVKEWVDVHADPVVAKEMIQSLPALPTGTAWFWAPGSDLLQKTQVRRRTTFDSSATPKPGQRVKAPKALATVDIEKLGAEISATVQRAKENSPAELKAKIRKLEAELAKPKQAFDSGEIDGLRKLRDEMELRVGVLERDLKNAHDAKDAAIAALESFAQQFSFKASELRAIRFEAAKETLLRLPTPKIFPAIEMRSKRIVEQLAAPKTASTSDGPRLTGTALKIAGIAAGYAQRGEGISKKLLATLCGMSVDGGGFNARLSEARTAGAIVTEGGEVFATPEGRTKYAGAFDAPNTTDEVLALWRPKLSGKALQMFEYLVSLGGRSISRQQLAEAVGMEASGGGFAARLSETRSTGLLLENRSEVAVNPELLFL